MERSRGVLGSTRDILPPAAEIAHGDDYPPCLLAAVDHAVRMEEQDRPRSVGEWRKELTGETPVPETRVTTLATPETRPPAVRAGQPDNDTPMTRSRRIGFIGAAAALLLGIGSLGWWQWSGVDETLEDRIIDSRLKATEHRSDEQVATLRGSLEKANSAAESSRKQIEELTAKLEELEAARKSISNDKVTLQPLTRDDQLRSQKQDALIAELRAALEAANTASDDARQQAGELAARLRILEALQHAKNVEISAQRQEIDGLLAAADDDIRLLRLTTPVGDNAHERYRRVLELEENNADALLGLELIVEKYIELAKLARDDEQFDKAEDYLNRASTVLPTYAALATARDKLAETQPVPNPRNRATESKQPDLQSPVEEGLVKLEAGTREDDANPESQGQMNESLPTSHLIPETQFSPLRLAVLPFAKAGATNSDAARELLRFIRTDLAAHSGFKVVYSYYSPEHDHKLIGDSNSLWQGKFAAKAPIDSRVYELSEIMKADVALTYFHRPRLAGWGGNDMFSVNVYIFDLKFRRHYGGTSHERGFKDVTHQLLKQLIRDRKNNPQNLPAARSAAVGAHSPSPLASLKESGGSSSKSPVNVAIFPFIGRQSSDGGLDETISSKLTSEISKSGRFRIVYSYYDPEYDANRAGKIDRLWTGGPVTYQLDKAQAIEFARELDADVIVAAQHPLTHSGQWGHDFDVQDFAVDIYLLDVRRKILYHQMGKLEVADKIFSRLAVQAGIAGTSPPVETGQFSVAILPYHWNTTRTGPICISAQEM